MLFTADHTPFANGLAKYRYAPIKPEDRSNRILLNVEIEGVAAIAALDTGGAYCILSPFVSHQIGFDPNAFLERTQIGVRDRKYTGRLHEVELTITANAGHPQAIGVTAFILDPGEEEAWEHERLPCFLGLQSCLDRLRFAIDPLSDLFYFGAGSIGY